MQSFLHLLQRVRQFLQARRAGGDVPPRRSPGGLGTTIITISGGEPLLHPELEEIIAPHSPTRHSGRHDHQRLLAHPQRIERLNRAGLDHLQISIDNVQPDEVSKKSLKVLDHKLQMLARYADISGEYQLGAGQPVRNPDDALAVAHRALELGFTSTVGILHDHEGQLQPLGEHQREIFAEIMQMGKRSYARFNRFQRNISQGLANDWRCRAGSRYLYICEDGLVH